MHICETGRVRAAGTLSSAFQEVLIKDWQDEDDWYSSLRTQLHILVLML
jgi:hypothetical protein